MDNSYIKGAERLLDEFYLHVSATVASALADEWGEVQAAQTRSVHVRAALLAHIQRGAVPEGWHFDESKARSAYWGSYPDGDSERCDVWMTAFRWVRAMLAAAPAPDQFRDAAGMIAPDAVFAVIYDDRERQPEIIHTETAARERFKRVSDQWNAHLFVKVESNSRDCRYYDANIASVLIPSGLADPAPAEVPMIEDWREPHPPHRNCMCPYCIPSFDDRFTPPADVAPADVPMPDVVGYVERWGGACRYCADESGVCPSTGLPCGGQRKAIEYVIRALQYGVKHGYIVNLFGTACRAADEAAGYARGLADGQGHCRRLTETDKAQAAAAMRGEVK